jgi:3-hydroxyisobutyrate dehydrogenase
MEITFIGLGNMGFPMASNLIKAGFKLTVFDVVAEFVRRCVELGAKASASVVEAVQNAEAVITMVPASSHVLDLYLGSGAIVAATKPTTLLIDCSTISVEASRKVASAAAGRGQDMIDAPVSGGTQGAINATLTFMVGGEANAVERARPLLEKMGKTIRHAGPSGAGQTVKMCNNMLLGIQMVGTSEALKLGLANGVDPRVLSEIMCSSSGRNWTLEVYNPCPGIMDNTPASRGYSGGFSVDLMYKDLGLAQESAIALQVATPLGSMVRNLYALHSRASGHLDFSSIYQFLSGKNA